MEEGEGKDVRSEKGKEGAIGCKEVGENINVRANEALVLVEEEEEENFVKDFNAEMEKVEGEPWSTESVHIFEKLRLLEGEEEVFFDVKEDEMLLVEGETKKALEDLTRIVEGAFVFKDRDELDDLVDSLSGLSLKDESQSDNLHRNSGLGTSTELGDVTEGAKKKNQASPPALEKISSSTPSSPSSISGRSAYMGYVKGLFSMWKGWGTDNVVGRQCEKGEDVSRITAKLSTEQERSGQKQTLGSQVVAKSPSISVAIPNSDAPVTGEVGYEGAVAKTAGGRGNCSQCGACKAASAMAKLGGIEGLGVGGTVRPTMTRESMASLLAPVEVDELRNIAILSALSDMAYGIANIQATELAQLYNLKYVNTSMASANRSKRMAMATAESGSAANSRNGGGESEGRNGAYAFAVAAASYLLPSWGGSSSPFQNVDGKSGTGERKSAEMISMGRESEGQAVNGRAVKVGGREQLEDKSLLMRTGQVDGRKYGKKVEQGKGKDSKELEGAVCPCEWFVCDDMSSTTRYFVIQGSESMASWIANIKFDPAPFEEEELGVMVHRGIYEVAKALFRELIPHIRAHLAAHGDDARVQFTGHSLGGSLATLLALMLLKRSEVYAHHVLPIYTFGSPSIMCGGDHLLALVGLQRSHVRNVIMHRDIVPRAFSCEYPDHISSVLRQISSSLRQHPCLLSQKVMYAPTGEMLILQPDSRASPHHPLLPHFSALFRISHANKTSAAFNTPGISESDITKALLLQVKAAELTFLNSPHPLEILSDRAAYGADGAISRDHDPRSYSESIAAILRVQLHLIRRTLREERRRQQWQPIVNGGGGFKGLSSEPTYERMVLPSFISPEMLGLGGGNGLSSGGAMVSPGAASRLGIQARAMQQRVAKLRASAMPSSHERAGTSPSGAIAVAAWGADYPRPSVQQLGLLALVCILSQALT